MVQTMLVPLDGSALAERAVPYAAGLARASGAQLIVFHVTSAYGMRGDLAFDPEIIAKGLRQDGLRADSLAYDMFVGGRGSVIASAAQDQDADLIVMSTHGRTGPGRWFYGSVAADVLHNSTTPMLMVPARCDHPWPSGRPACTLVPLDGSTFAEQVLDPACELVGDGTVLLLHVVDPELYGGDEEEGKPVRQSAIDEAETYLRGISARVRSTGASVMTRVLVGAPNDVIAAEARAWEADLIAMATHGRTGLARLMLGSVAAAVLQRTEVPVLFVRPVGVTADAAWNADSAESMQDVLLDPNDLDLIEYALTRLLTEEDPSATEPARALLERFEHARTGGAPDVDCSGPTTTATTITTTTSNGRATRT